MKGQISHLREKILVNNLMYGAIGASSRNMDMFSSWLLVVFAAGGGALLSNLGQVVQHASSYTLHVFFSAFFIVIILGVVAKILAVLIAGACAGSAIGRVEGREAAENDVDLDFAVVFSELESIVPRPGRWFVKRSLAKAAQGRLTEPTRGFAILMQLQALCTLAQAVAVIWVVGALACGVTF